MNHEDRQIVYLALGSNLGDRAGYLATARAGLDAAGLRLERQSPVYETAPWGPVPQDAYLNQVLAFDTTLKPDALLRLTRGLETLAGRVRSLRYGPRTLDIDLLSMGELQLQTPALTLPHPRLLERAFVLAPWADIAPDYRLPGSGQTVAQAWQALLAREPALQQSLARWSAV